LCPGTNGEALGASTGPETRGSDDLSMPSYDRGFGVEEEAMAHWSNYNGRKRRKKVMKDEEKVRRRNRRTGLIGVILFSLLPSWVLCIIKIDCNNK
jgi:hypothetical protein